ncbi:MAG: TonB family protein [Candidatus Angelobacter sp.]
MFGETLLESSPAARKGKRWSMATAFTLETILAGIAVLVPLLSTGVIPLSARVAIVTPLRQNPVEPVEGVPVQRNCNCGPTTSAPQPQVVALVSDNPNAIYTGPRVATTTNPEEATPYSPYAFNNALPSNLIDNGNDHGPTIKPGVQRVISVLSEAQLINRVEPVYPKIAIAAGVQGEVKLHAIIARDGRIMSLNVISGHPLLVRAAEDAVGQWRYRPYYLNGQAVEVETFITVNFRKEGH